MNERKAKRYKTKIYYLPKDIINIYNNTISRKNFYDQSINSDARWYEELLSIGQDIDYITGCLLDYEHMKNHHRLIAVR